MQILHTTDDRQFNFKEYLFVSFYFITVESLMILLSVTYTYFKIISHSHFLWLHASQLTLSSHVVWSSPCQDRAWLRSFKLTTSRWSFFNWAVFSSLMNIRSDFRMAGLVGTTTTQISGTRLITLDWRRSSSCWGNWSVSTRSRAHCQYFAERRVSLQDLHSDLWFDYL